MNIKFFILFCLLFIAVLRINAQIIIEQKPPETVYVNDSINDPVSEKHFKVGLFLPFFKDGGDTTGGCHSRHGHFAN